MQGATLFSAHLNDAYLVETCLRRAKLTAADLRGTVLSRVDLQGAVWQSVLLDGSALLYKCQIDRHTDFRGAALDSARIDPPTKQLLEHNIRRLNWEDWHKEHRSLAWLVRPFWWMSDYGRSTGRIIAVFFGLAILFAAIYWIWGLVAPPGIVDKLFLHENALANLARAIYFSIVTMTTLGFGDMYAARSIPGYVFLTIQVLLGYVLLAALVTRFAILLTAGGPAGKFSKPEKKPSRQERGERGG